MEDTMDDLEFDDLDLDIELDDGNFDFDIKDVSTALSSFSYKNKTICYISLKQI